MHTLRHARTTAALGEPDRTLTPRAGLQLVAELDRALGIADSLDAASVS